VNAVRKGKAVARETKRKHNPHLSPKTNEVSIVGIGASAGGLEALLKLLRRVPPNNEFAFVVVQHLDPSHSSLSVEIIEKSTNLKIQEVRSGIRIKPNEIYVVPPNSVMKYSGGKLMLSPRKKWPAAASVIDYFFSSIAKARKEKAVGILLSGTGSDGTEGLSAIKKVKGMTFAQLPSSAKFSEMPQNAINAGVVDFVLPAENIISQVIKKSKSRQKINLRSSNVKSDDTDPANSFIQKIFDILLSNLKIDFTEYKQSTINRRIQRRIATFKLKSYEEYYNYLNDHPEEIQALYNDILINVTEFFREPDSFKALKKNVFPLLLKNRPQRTAIRIWVPGCATGEEAYSIAMALTAYMQEEKKIFPVQIFATDISEPAINKARVGHYDNSITGNVPKKFLETYFEKTETGYKICKSIRDLCLFSKHDVTTDPPFAKLDLISCRNVLIYFTAGLQKRVFPIFNYALNPDGFLWLGRSENPGEFARSFTVVDKKQKIYKKSKIAIAPKFFFPARQHLTSLQNKTGQTQSSGRYDFEKGADELILSKYSPPGAVVNSDLEILQFRGQTFPYLETASGKPSLNILKMIRPELLAGLRTAFQSAKNSNKIASRKGLLFEISPKLYTVDIEVVPMNPGAPLKERTFLIMFKRNSEVRQASSISKPPTTKKNKHTGAISQYKVKELISELSELKDFQKSLIEQYEASQEELIAANEELQSTNEEFLSANEEIETSKEELQSTNEELITVNDELQARNSNLTTLSSDLNNLLASVEIPVLIVGSDFRIRIFSPKAKSAFNLIPTDVGRPISDIKSNFNIDLAALVAEVVEDLNSKEIEVQDRKGIWYRIQIRPYRTIEHQIDGAVIAVIDINYLKQKEMRTKENLQYIKSILYSVPLPLVVINDQFLLRSPNPSFNQYFKVPSDLGEYDIFELLNLDRASANELRSQLSKTLKGSVPTTDFTVQCEIPGLGARKIMLSAGKVHPDTDEQASALISFVDVTQASLNEENQKLLLLQEQESAKKANAANQEKDQFLATLSHELRTPLSSILAWAQLISQGKVDLEKAKMGAAVIERSAKTQTQLINDLLDISRITAGKLSLTIKAINPLADIRAAVESVKPMADAKSIQIVTDLGHEEVLIHGDSVRIQQIVWNLLTNAVKFSPKQSSIQVKVETGGESEKQYFRIIVADHGKGIPPEFVERIFQRFSQADSSSTRVHGGLGIGLSIVSHLVSLQGGTIQVENASGDETGAIFTVSFPLISLNKSQAVRMEFNGEKSRGSGSDELTISPDLHGLRILFVDDDDNARDAICIYLRSFGAEVVSLSSAKEGIDEILNFRPHVLVSDISMPEEDGYSFIQRVRQLNPNEGGSIPALALTANASNEDRDRALEAGFQEHIAKPVAADQLGQIILQICR
jgi:two-component system CheB/CheR fusion protein